MFGMKPKNVNKNIGNNIQGSMRGVESGKYGDLTSNDAVRITAWSDGFKVEVLKDSVKRIPAKK